MTAERSINAQTILIVDDEAENVRVLGRALEEVAKVRGASSGEAALEILGSGEAIDLVLLDVMMPGLDGHEVCRRIKAEPATQGIPVIFVTARSSEQDEAAGLSLGAVDYITKPFRLPILRARVRNHLELKRKTDLLERHAMFDGLTCIPNRRRFDKTLVQEWRRAARAGNQLSLVMIEVDFFEQYRESNSHVASNICLALVAGTLDGAVGRAGDLVARYGSQQFAALLPGADPETARQAAEKMAAAVRSLKLKHRGSKIGDHVTVSLGAASTQPRSDGQPLSLVTAADEALGRAKGRRGRDRVEAE